MKWPTIKFAEAGEVVTGATPPTNNVENYGGSIPFVTPSELDTDVPITYSKAYLSHTGIRYARIIPQESVMVCCIGSLGKVGFAGTALATNQQINSIIFNENIVYPRFGYHFCKTLRPLLKHMAPATTVPIVTKSRFSEIRIPIPPLHEQKRIAAILDKADGLRRKRREAIRLSEEFLRSVFLEMFGDPVTNPKGWQIRKLGEIGRLERGVSKHRPRNASELLHGPYPLIQTGDVANSGGYISEYLSTYSEAGLRQSRLWPKDTLCITIAANIARAGILMIDACFPDSVVGFVPGQDVHTEYVMRWLSFVQSGLEALAPQVAQKNINLEILRELPIPLPYIELQIQYAKIVEKVLTIKNRTNACVDYCHSISRSLQLELYS